ncbi:hypothetical protein DDB_G0272286 [Dictyostelium discoideum AX4]|uniref:Uncharacterized protein n=1 Tax=Dictyostelium discoideum TaxID=44689 RepID=Q559T5_DICDI|nr:hypothetical protein DDB_G0272286 [Dictyostelium discoideum AX4]EAL71295.1 hypothetical protein DDB_G0272286 [Dictyostelium discoideum AX4]|eukprot:XP_645249.1 hypothetical protein DDB_G0272286 [Dictyostelium discoideum AX4]
MGAFPTLFFFDQKNKKKKKRKLRNFKKKKSPQNIGTPFRVKTAPVNFSKKKKEKKN